MRCAELFREELVLHELGVLETENSLTPKYGLNKLLEPKTVPHINPVVCYHTSDDGETYSEVSWKVKTNCVKVNKRKNNIISTIIFSDFFATLPGDPVFINIHCFNGSVNPPNIFVCPKLCELYYKGYSDADISNHFRKGGLNL